MRIRLPVVRLAVAGGVLLLSRGGAARVGSDHVVFAVAAGVALSQITPLLEDHLPIDTLEILLPTDQSAGAIGVGKYVHKDVYVRYGRTLSRDPVDQVSIELRINKHWSLESQASSDENAGADLIWSFDF